MENDKYQKFRQIIKEALDQQRLTGRQLSLKIGVHPSYMNLVLSGKRNPPSEKKIVKIAEVLNLDAANLLMEAGLLPAQIKKILLSAQVAKVAKEAGYNSVAEFFADLDKQQFRLHVKDPKTGKLKEIKAEES